MENSEVLFEDEAPKISSQYAKVVCSKEVLTKAAAWLDCEIDEVVIYHEVNLPFKLDYKKHLVVLKRDNNLLSPTMCAHGLSYCKVKFSDIKVCVHSFTENYKSNIENFILYKKNSALKISRATLRVKKQNPLIVPILSRQSILDEIETNSIKFIKNHDKFKKYGVTLNRGILLSGPPGNGKTLICSYIKNLAEKHKIYPYTVKGSDIEEGFSRGNLGWKLNQKLVFVDDVDISYFTRTGGHSNIACELLSILDGVDKSTTSSVKIFTTNESIDSIDKAFLRPGRIDYVYKIDIPTRESRLKLIQSWDKEILKHVSVEQLLEDSEGLSMSHLDSYKSQIVSCIIEGKAPQYIKFEDVVRKGLGFS